MKIRRSLIYRMARLWWLRFTTRATWIITVRIIWKKEKNKYKKQQKPQNRSRLRMYLRRQDKSYAQYRLAFYYFCCYTEIVLLFLCVRALEKIYIHNAFVSCIIFDPFLFITSVAARNITHTQAVKTENAIVDRAQRICNDIGVRLLCSCIIFI